MSPLIAIGEALVVGMLWWGVFISVVVFGRPWINRGKQ